MLHVRLQFLLRRYRHSRGVIKRDGGRNGETSSLQVVLDLRCQHRMTVLISAHIAVRMLPLEAQHAQCRLSSNRCGLVPKREKRTPSEMIVSLLPHKQCVAQSSLFASFCDNVAL